MKNCISIVCLLFASVLFAQDWHESYQDALANAKEQDKTLLLVFAGSDWCAPCIKLDKLIWQSEAFQTYAEKNYVLYRADFPRKKTNRLPETIAEQNRLLAEKYNSKGHFPLVVLLDKNEKILGETGYLKGSPDTYIEHLKTLIK